MIVLDNGDALRGVASVADKIDYTVNGYVGTTATQLADGQLGGAEANLYLSGADGIVITSITLVNTDTAARTVDLFVKPSAGTSRRIIPKTLSLGISHSLYTDGQRITVLNATGAIVSSWEGTVDDTPVNGETTHPISSNWAYDHVAAADPHVGYVLESLFDAQTILSAVSDNTPIALAVAEQRIIGRKTGGNIAALAGADALLAMGISATVAELNYVDGVSSALQDQLDGKQPLDATLTSIALLGTAANKIAYTTNVDVWAEAAITAAGRSMVGAANAAAQLALMTTALKAELDLLDLAGLTVGEVLVATGAAAAAWQSTGVKLSAPDISGVVTAAATLTLPAHTLGGNIHADSNQILGLYQLQSSIDQTLYIAGIRQDSNTSLRISSPGAGPEYAGTYRCQFNGRVAIATVAWTACAHTGLVLGGALDLAGQKFTGYMTMEEMAAPGAGAANTVRHYASVGGDTFTDMNCVFQDGTVVTYAEETTPLDSPLFTHPSGIEVKIVTRKPHPGLLEVVVEYPDGKTFPLKKIEWHDAEKIAANKGCEGLLPADWEVTTLQERVDKQVAILDEQITSVVNQISKLDAELKNNATILEQLADIELDEKQTKEKAALEARQLEIPQNIEQANQSKVELNQKKQVELDRLVSKE